MQYQLVFRFWKSSLESPDQIQSLERALAEVLGDAVQLDGHDVGSRDVDLFLMTPDPAATLRRSKPALEQLALLQKVVAAYRVEGGIRFKVIWPLKYARRFNLP